MKININNFIKKMVLFICIYMMIIDCFCSMLGVPKIIRYIPDIIIPILLIYILSRIEVILKNKEINKIFLIIFLFFIHCIVGYIINMYSIAYLFWGIRNIFRFLIVFLCAIITFEKKDVEKYIKIINTFFVLNVVFAMIQYFIYGYWGDRIGGTFGAGVLGVNGGLVYILILENIIITNDYLKGKCSLKKMLIVIFASILIAIIAELKAVYLFLVVIIVLSLLLNRFSLKMLGIIIGIILAFQIGYNILCELDPVTAKTMNIESLMEYAGGESHGYSTKYDISRVRAFKQINEYFFKDSIVNKIWGFGLGSCDTSSFGMFNSVFAQQYNNIFHYTWFTHAMLYIETGILGYLIYMIIYIYIIIYCFKKRKFDKTNNYLYNIEIVLSISSIIMSFYNSSLRNDYVFFVYVFLALIFAINKNSTNNKKDEKKF